MFPFEYPTPSIFYLALYGVTLVLHVLPMNYVLAGSTYLAALAVWEWLRGPASAHRLLGEKLRDWMPFALGVTITAAVAPLLFLQILYQHPFYTANLLLFHRWMAILPVMIVAFYLLYLQKSKRWDSFQPWVRAGVSVGILACFAFVAWSWTENHLLSLRNQETWSSIYVSPAWFYRDDELIPRLLVWYVGAFPVLATALAWQLWYDRRAPQDRPADAEVTEKKEAPSSIRPLAIMALSGLAGSVVAGGIYFAHLDASLQNLLLSAKTLPYVAAAAVGLLVQAAAWLLNYGAGHLAGSKLGIATAGIIVAVSAATVLREVRRTAAIDLYKFAPLHAAASQMGGFGTFALFFVVNTVLIVGVVVAVRRRLRPVS